MLYEYNYNFFTCFFFYLSLLFYTLGQFFFFNKTIVLLTVVGYEIIIYNLIFNAHLWNHC